ncbi:putative tail assembly protein [Rhizobium phage RHph_X2_30]|nr:putative tail assembly protein [Rhizobium phage RHph_X2_30]
MDFLWAIGLLLASYAIQMLIPKAKGPSQKPASLSDFDFPQFEEGTPQPVIFGDVWTDDMFVLWYGNMRTSAVKTKSSKK